MKQKEKTVVNRIIKALRLRKLYVRKMHGGPYMQPGIPDLLVIVRGLYVGLEVKLPGAKLSHAQEAAHRRIKEAGGIVAVVHDVEEALAVVDRLPPDFEL